MEEKIMNMLEQLYVEVKGIKIDLTDTNKRLGNMEADIKALKQGQSKTEEQLTRIEGKVDSIDNKLDDMEAQNANRHIELSGKIDSLSKDISFVEAVTGKNTADIAFIKLAK